MTKLKHLRLLGNRQLSEVANVKFNYGAGTKKEEEEPVEPDYYFMALVERRLLLLVRRMVPANVAVNTKSIALHI